MLPLPPALETMLTEQFGVFGPLVPIGLIGVLLVVVALPLLVARRPSPFEKLREGERKAAPEPNGGRQTLRTHSRAERLEKYSNILEPQDAEEYSAARLRLLQAGYRSRHAVRTYHFAQFSLGILLLIGGAVWALAKSASGTATTQGLVMTVLLPGVIGYMLPKYWVKRRRTARIEEITNGFPDALDMMLVCVEAGQSLDQSIIRVSREIRAGYPALAEEFELVAWELKAGKDKPAVLRDLAERAGSPDVASFTTVLIQSQTFGTSIADALRVYAAEMRDKRVMRAEEEANKLPTKMTLATMMLTVPPLLIILLGPSVYNIVTTLGGGL